MKYHNHPESRGVSLFRMPWGFSFIWNLSTPNPFSGSRQPDYPSSLSRLTVNVHGRPTALTRQVQHIQSPNTESFPRSGSSRARETSRRIASRAGDRSGVWQRDRLRLRNAFHHGHNLPPRTRSTGPGQEGGSQFASGRWTVVLYFGINLTKTTVVGTPSPVLILTR